MQHLNENIIAARGKGVTGPCAPLSLFTCAGITDKATIAEVEAELEDLEEVEPSWDLPAELLEYG
jgi:hypothetical protein